MFTRWLAPLRKRPVAFWALGLFLLAAYNVFWIVTAQPTMGRWLHPWEIAYLLLGSAFFIVYLFAGWNNETLRAAGSVLARSRWTGILITLTTIILLVLFGEWYLRLFYITTDAYGFTAMNYWWYQNYGLAQDNSLGYRDKEPMPDSPDLIRVAVLGDSFAMGHGINDINETFTQRLEARLSPGVDFDLIADSGRDLDLHLAFLEQYPFEPDIVIYSYYLNDIDYLLTGDAAPDSSFAFIQNDALESFVRTFFLPNYIYYNLAQFTNQQRNQGFVDSLVSAYDDPQMWDEQQFRLNQLISWAEDRDIPMIALIWPHIASIQESQTAVHKVSDVFLARGVDVVDMSGILGEQPVNRLVVNRFDTHPSAFAHELAANALEPVVRRDIDLVRQRRAGS